MNSLTKFEVRNWFNSDNTNGLFGEKTLNQMNEDLLDSVLGFEDENDCYDESDVKYKAERIIEKN